MSEIYIMSEIKSSFDRFDVDLSQLILSYLPFEDKISKESVSHKFSHFVYAKQITLKSMKF